ncbi:MAG: type II toxin-antitoxin system VapC family toxin [Verrucomicrobiota bacterium]
MSFRAKSTYPNSMSYLVDTNVWSELTKGYPQPEVIRWLTEHESLLHISTISLGELRYGIVTLPESQRKEELQGWLKQLTKTTAGRTLSFNRSVAYTWADLRASASRKGYRLPLADSMIAAIAKKHQLKVVTRNVRDFQNAGVSTVNPFALSK